MLNAVRKALALKLQFGLYITQITVRFLKRTRDDGDILDSRYCQYSMAETLKV